MFRSFFVLHGLSSNAFKGYFNMVTKYTASNNKTSFLSKDYDTCQEICACVKFSFAYVYMRRVHDLKG